jgi:hypothetical protein
VTLQRLTLLAAASSDTTPTTDPHAFTNLAISALVPLTTHSLGSPSAANSPSWPSAKTWDPTTATLPPQQNCIKQYDPHPPS